MQISKSGAWTWDGRTVRDRNGRSVGIPWVIVKECLGGWAD